MRDEDDCAPDDDAAWQDCDGSDAVWPPGDAQGRPADTCGCEGAGSPAGMAWLATALLLRRRRYSNHTSSPVCTPSASRAAVPVSMAMP